MVEPPFRDVVFGRELFERLSACALVVAPIQSLESEDGLDEVIRGEVEVIVSSWGMPRLDVAFLTRYPALRAVFYAAGSVRSMVTPESWARGVRVVSAAGANAVPVAEFTLAQIILCLKRVWQKAEAVKAKRTYMHGAHDVIGAYHATVGLISLGRIGRLVARRLDSLDVEVVVYDPCIAPAEARELGVRLCSLDEVFEVSDVVSCHMPELPKTQGAIRGRHFRAMPRKSSFINTARGGVVCEPEMIEVLRERPDLFAVLDVTEQEPPAPDSVLYDLPNVLLTPHVAGSIGGECRRMGCSIVEEVERFAAGEPLQHELTQAASLNMA